MGKRPTEAQQKASMRKLGIRNLRALYRLAHQLSRERCLAVQAIINNNIVIPDDMAAIHGITTEIASRDGIPPEEAINHFLDMVRQADLIVGHNVSFDIRMMRIMVAKTSGEKWDNPLPTFCTMRKSPMSAKSYRRSRARPDCDGSRRIYFHLRSIEQ